MNLPGIFRKTMRELRWQVFWYGLGLGLLAALVVFIYPSYSEQMADFEIPDALEGFTGGADYTTPEGFLSAEFFSFAPAVLCIFAIMAGTSALAGEEAAGTLELLLAQPLSRRRLVLEKIAALVSSTCLIVVVTSIGWLVSVPFVDIDISYLKLITATARMIPIVLVFEAMALWAAARIADRSLATGVVTAVAIGSYFAEYLASVVDALKPLHWLSLFYYHDGANALSRGLDPLKLAVLVVVTIFFAYQAVSAFERREIGVSATPTSRNPLHLLRFRRAA